MNRETGGKIRECLRFFDCLFRINFFAHVLGHPAATPVFPFVEEVFKAQHS